MLGTGALGQFALGQGGISGTAYAVSVAETLVLVDAQAGAVVIPAALADALGLAASQEGTVVIPAALADNLLVVDTQTGGAVFAMSVADLLALADTQDATVIEGAKFTVSGPGVEMLFPDYGVSNPEADVCFPYKVVRRTT